MTDAVLTADALQEQMPRTQKVIQEGIERQFHLGCQLYISLAGRVMADCGVGDSHPGQAMTSDTINLWLSAGKPLTAAAILQQWERERLQLDDRIADFIPEFAQGGKQSITFRHILTHTCGFRNVDTGWPEQSWDEILRRICVAPLEDQWIIGRSAGYHTSTSWFILGDVLARLTGRRYADAMRHELFEPAGMRETWAALAFDQWAAFGPRLGWMYGREQGELRPLDWHHAARCAAASPGSNTRGPIRDLGRFYEMLLHGGAANGRRCLSPQTVDAMTARHRVGRYDETLMHVVDFGLGVIIDSNQYGIDTVPYGYGRYCSPRTFGHGGAQSSQGLCDPEAGLVIAYFFNGRPGEGQNVRRTRQLNEAIYLDLHLAIES